MTVSDLDNLAYVLKNFTNYRKGTVGEESVGRGGTWAGVKFLKDKDHQRIAQRLLSRNWHGKKCASSMMTMAREIEYLLVLTLSWKDRVELGRVLISSLTYAEIYYAERDPNEKESPYRLYKTGQEVEESIEYTWRTSTDPFPRWTKPYDVVGNNLLRPSHPCPPQLEPDPYILPPSDNRKIPWIEAVHKLESVPYRINKELLEVALELDKDESTRLYPFEWDEYDDRRKACDDQYIHDNIKELEKKVLKYKVDENGEFILDKKGKKQPFTKADKVKDKHLANFTPEEIEKWNAYWHDHYLIEQTKQRIEQRRAQYERDRDEATQLKDWERFYQRVSVDYRGRFYLPDFSYQGSDFCRAVIEFADGQTVNKQGNDFLLNHLANHAELDGGYGEKAVKAYAENTLYFLIADNPIAFIKELKKVDKPLCYLRACMEWRDVMAPRLKRHFEQNPTETSNKDVAQLMMQMFKRAEELELHTFPTGGQEFLSHLPIEIDQSSSAFQHIAGMMNDDNLRERAISSESIYLGVADLLKIKPVNGVEPSRGERKKIVKTIAVAWGYGATDGTCKTRLLEYRRDVEHATPYLRELTDDEVKDLGAQVIKLLEKEFKTCVDYRERVKEAVGSVLKNGQSFDTMMEHKEDAVTWTTPSLFIARQRIHIRDKKTPVRIYSGGDTKKDIKINLQEPTDSINKKEMKSKAPPNLVHSYDACLIHGLLYAGLPKPIWDEHDVQMSIEDESYVIKYPVITIHDAFACHANNVQDLKGKVTHGMAMLYMFDPMERFLAQLEGTSYTIRDIDIDWTESSGHAFS